MEWDRAAVLENLRNMPFAPSAQMQHVPYDVDDDEGDSDSDLDVRISRAPSLSLSPCTLDLLTDAIVGTGRIQSSRRHEEQYPSSDEDADSLQRRKRRFAKSYITSSAASRKASKMHVELRAEEEEEVRPKRSFFRSKFEGPLGRYGGKKESVPGANGRAEEWRNGIM